MCISSFLEDSCSSFAHFLNLYFIFSWRFLKIFSCYKFFIKCMYGNYFIGIFRLELLRKNDSKFRTIFLSHLRNTRIQEVCHSVPLIEGSLKCVLLKQISSLRRKSWDFRSNGEPRNIKGIGTCYDIYLTKVLFPEYISKSYKFVRNRHNLI